MQLVFLKAEQIKSQESTGNLGRWSGRMLCDSKPEGWDV